MPLLQPHIRQQFDRDGYLLLREIVPITALRDVLGAIERAVDQKARDYFREGTIANLHEHEPFERRWQNIVADMENDNRPTRRSWDDDIVEEAVFDLMRNSSLLDVIESLIGPEITALGVIAVRPKIPGDKRTVVQWHQDSHYYGADSADQEILTVWLPLVDATHENGCMQIIPGSHRWGLQPAEKDPEHNVFRPVDDPTLRGEVVTCEMRVGDLMVFNNLAFHRSTENESDHTRWSIDLRFCRPSTTFARLPQFMPGFLARSSSRKADSWSDWEREVGHWRQAAQKRT